MAGHARPLAERLAERIHVDLATGCWNWTGSTNASGYGVVSVNRQGRNLTRRAHREMYLMCVGPIPDGLQLDHLCRNRRCVNPEHLEPVTNLENARRGVRATKTECRNGHPLEGDNLMTKTNRYGNTQRECRTCDRARQRAAYAARTTGEIIDAEVVG